MKVLHLTLATIATVLVLAMTPFAQAGGPNLVVNLDDVLAMRSAVKEEGRFRDAFQASKGSVDKRLGLPINVPLPKDGGGGFTHERHKQNYKLMYDAGILYQVTEDPRYAQRVRDMLLTYSDMYPALPLHPKRKPNAQNPGKLFWQSLNESVWLVYTIQAYDLIRETLSDAEMKKIERDLLRPVALFLSEESPATFNKVHNHGTWATAAVGMTGYVLGEQDWVEKALLDLSKSGKGGFLRQISDLFSPDGYYNEGPYYQRYALMPFVTFAKAIDNNEPQREIFKYRDGLLLKAIDTTIQLSYNKLFFPINDAIRSKGIDTEELVLGVTIAYGLTRDSGLLDIAQQQESILLTGDGLRVAQALDAGKATPYSFRSQAFSDGRNGDEGALVVMRQPDQALVFKPAAQGMGHGHFDKLSWQFYDSQEEVVSDYGAARFLNVEAKFGGRYLPENKSYAKQTVAHNTVVINETSHFNGDVKTGNQHHPELIFFGNDERMTISAAKIDTAYSDVQLKRTLALLRLSDDRSLVVDVFDVASKNPSQYDLPLHYQGQLVDTSFEVVANAATLPILGQKNGYQHLWLKGVAQPEAGLAKVTWLNRNGRFYTKTLLNDGATELLFTQLGGSDPNFNLRSENSFIQRKQQARAHAFVSLLEPHGEYNPAREFTIGAESQVVSLSHEKSGSVDVVSFGFADGTRYLLAFNSEAGATPGQESAFEIEGTRYALKGRYQLFELPQKG
ncbi:heparinase II/III domain-containing protein [Biformimicrobium ophioploci]|uniref:Alginate lyase n=1 Tax=Biformimicrobium ophioploci TaxID=3036711 RepID=A0ABQ6LUY7_9GAMM|nr:heparinase II/III family protein [Microbulbifer sp. NKW57]GMG85866.1 hypothetical protein MNKW57_01870 [Microbulbifer sp. NKW57]